MKICLKGAQVFVNNHISRQDILIDNDRISQIAPQINCSEAQIVPLNPQQVIAPGFIDVHVHLREPGFTQKETIKTGTLAAAHGGYTTVAAMPNVKPVPDTPQKLQAMVQLNQREAQVHVLQYASITKERTSEQLVDFAGMKAAGAFGFSNDGSGVQSANTMYQAMQAAHQVNLPLMAHIEDESLMNQGVMNAGATAQRLGLPGILPVAETAQLARDLELAAATGVHYHACHVSTANSVALIRFAKQRHLNVSAEVAPHHLLLDESMITKDNPQLKMNPPLRTLSDRQALLAGLLDGTIDMIATDHAPHTVADKAGSMKTAAFGITGLETSFPLLYTHLVQPGICSLAQLIQWLSIKPAQVFNLTQAGQLASGLPADLTILNVQDETTITAQHMYSQGLNSPFIGAPVTATIQATMVGGQWVYRKEQA
ncbi:dihydroorotase [Bombilactobacillus bombi]|uniref:Dihydroorotase n=1 Tax=Bombilactobacillus bombi TaxID=1303590 RepID=A0A417ZI46_9LACO|nr:dihydroorotase [Bombilactobacillus bombi]RHW51364.1 dihydroorotase [Bombilactobacillus bombi]